MKKVRSQHPTSRKHKSALAQPPPATDLRDFTIAFFALFGATVTPLDKQPHGPVKVVLNEELTEHFGASELGLAFQNVEEGSHHLLVAHGSRTFDRMLNWLDRRAAVTVRLLPVNHVGSEQLLHAMQPRNAGVSNLKLSEEVKTIFAFDWRLTYRADDKREEIYRVALDDAGALAFPGGTLSFEQLLKDSAPVQSDPDDEAPRLPPLTHLVRQAELARKFAVYHSDQQCVTHEAEVLPRLYKVLNRLSTYYGQQIEEIRDGGDPQGDRRESLEADLERKIAEEVENHRLRVQVQLSSYALVHLPTATADITLSDGTIESALRVTLNRYTGELLRPLCHACSAPMESVILCRNGHIACESCLRQCAACGDVLCAACGVLHCSVCNQENCENCGRTCWACGERACAEHVSCCPACGDEVCKACQSACAECGEVQCRSHLRADCVALDGVSRLVCARCAVRCPGCNQYSADNGTCDLSGQRFCRNCLVNCHQCGRLVGTGYYARSKANGQAYCRECVTICPGCSAVAAKVSACSICDGAVCESCAKKCHVCSGTLCSEHAFEASGCGHTLCSEHVLACALGGEAVCPECSETCAICDSAYCGHHQALCGWCGKAYCSACVDAGRGLCSTCSSVVRKGVSVEMLEEPCASSLDVRKLAIFYRWRRASNRDVTVYVGFSGRGNVLVVVRRGRDGREAVVTRSLSARDFLTGAMGK